MEEAEPDVRNSQNDQWEQRDTKGDDDAGTERPDPLSPPKRRLSSFGRAVFPVKRANGRISLDTVQICLSRPPLRPVLCNAGFADQCLWSSLRISSDNSSGTCSCTTS